jgi:hypothetical protein
VARHRADEKSRADQNSRASQTKAEEKAVTA